jgi:hypothetical protein
MKRDKWLTYLLIPVFLFFIAELVLDYVLTFDFRSTAIVGPYILLYYAGLWGLIGYSFKFEINGALSLWQPISQTCPFRYYHTFRGEIDFHVSL